MAVVDPADEEKKRAGETPSGDPNPYRPAPPPLQQPPPPPPPGGGGPTPPPGANPTGLADALGRERAGYGDRDPLGFNRERTNTIDRRERDIRNLQTEQLGRLIGAAEGRTPSVAEIQGRMQADRNAAQQFGMAAALSGASPGSALRQASLGAAQVQGEAGANAALLRAQETAAARNALTGALSGVRGLDQSQRGQEIDIGGMDLKSGLEQRGMDIDWRKALLSGQLTSQGQAGELSLGEERNRILKEQGALDKQKYEDSSSWKYKLTHPDTWLGLGRDAAKALLMP